DHYLHCTTRDYFARMRTLESSSGKRGKLMCGVVLDLSVYLIDSVSWTSFPARSQYYFAQAIVLLLSQTSGVVQFQLLVFQILLLIAGADRARSDLYLKGEFQFGKSVLFHFVLFYFLESRLSIGRLVLLDRRMVDIVPANLRSLHPS